VIVQLGSAEQSGEAQRKFTALVNPVILEADQERRDFDGCLSFPGLFGETIRPHSLRLSGLDEQGQPFERTFEGFDAVVIHHEVDHLDGVLFIDRIERMQDLYRLEKDPSGKSIRAPVSSILSREIQPGNAGKPGLVRSSGSKDPSRDAASSTPIKPNRK
jgi:hypothetical protein